MNNFDHQDCTGCPVEPVSSQQSIAKQAWDLLGTPQAGNILTIGSSSAIAGAVGLIAGASGCKKKETKEEKKDSE